MVNKLGTVSAFAIGVLATGAILAGNARADVFNTTLASPNGLAATDWSGGNPSWYNGGGPNPQGGWTTNTQNGIEVGLRAKYRGGPEINTPSDDYVVLPGSGPNPAYALWNYEFSIDLRPGGTGNLLLRDIVAWLTVTVRDSTNTIIATGTVNPATHWGDSAGFGSTGPTLANKNTAAATRGDWSLQNSQNLGFGDSPLAGIAGYNFNPNAAYTYDFSLRVGAGDTRSLVSTDMEVVVTPEPTSIILLASVMIGVLVLIRRRQTI